MKEQEVDKAKLAAAVSRKLAAHNLSDNVTTELATRILQTGVLPKDLEICTVGICSDHWVTPEQLSPLIEKVRGLDTGGVKIFPKGILAPEEFLVRVEHNLRR
ncbi:MAG: hypothetical protein ACI9QL_004513 [Candidatus Omnitrophota bacterium]